MSDKLSPELKAVVADFKGTLQKIRDKQDAYDADLRRGRADPLTKAAIERMQADLDGLHKKVNRPRIAGVSDSPSALESKADKEFGRWLGKDGSSAGRSRTQYAEVFSKYLRLDNKGALGPDEQKTLAVGSAPDGGFFVEPARATQMLDKLYETSDLRPHASIVTISSSSYVIPIDRDEPTTGWVGEQSSRPLTNTPQIGELDHPGA